MNDYSMDEIRLTRIRCTESFLTTLSGIRRVPATIIEDKAYNNALADVFDFYIDNHPKDLYGSTLRMGKRVRD